MVFGLLHHGAVAGLVKQRRDRAGEPPAGFGLFFAGAQQLSQLLQLQNSLRQCFNGRGGRLLHEQVALLTMLEGIENEIDCVTERHHEASHVRIRNGERLALVDLVAEQRND